MHATYSLKIVLFLISISLSSASLQYKCEKYGYYNEKVELISVPVYASLKWTQNIALKNVRLVDIGYSVSFFDYCDLSMYNKKGIQPLLDKFNVSSKTQDWVAVLDYTKISTCSTAKARFDLYW